MSIAEKLTAIAENVPQVYWSGHSNGHYTGSQEGYDSGQNDKENEINQHLTEPITTINEYLEEPIDPVSPHGRISYIDEKIPEVYENGQKNKQAEWVESDAQISEKLDNILAEQETIIAEQESYFGSEVEIPTDPDTGRDDIIVNPGDGEFNW